MKHYEITYSDGHDVCHYFGTEAEDLKKAIESLYESCGSEVKVLHVTEEWGASGPVLEDADFYDDIDEEFDDPAPAMVESNHGGTTMATKTSKERLDYIRDYDRANRLKVGGYLNRLHEPELCEYWESIPNKSDWIRKKLREDLERQKAGK